MEGNTQGARVWIEVNGLRIPFYLLPYLELGVLTAPLRDFLSSWRCACFYGASFPVALRPAEGNISPLHGS